jgi:hypothetical protein
MPSELCNKFKKQCPLNCVILLLASHRKNRASGSIYFGPNSFFNLKTTTTTSLAGCAPTTHGSSVATLVLVAWQVRESSLEFMISPNNSQRKR